MSRTQLTTRKFGFTVTQVADHVWFVCNTPHSPTGDASDEYSDRAIIDYGRCRMMVTRHRWFDDQKWQDAQYHFRLSKAGHWMCRRVGEVTDPDNMPTVGFNPVDGWIHDTLEAITEWILNKMIVEWE